MSNLSKMGHFLAERYAGALQYKDFRTLWFANLSAQAAAWGLIVARGWLVFDLTGSSAMVGAVTFAAMAPLFLVPPFSGVLADFMDRRTLLAWSYRINLLHNLVLATLALTGVIAPWHLIVLSVVNGIARSSQMPVSQALVADLVPKERLLNAYSLNAVTRNGARLIGPGLVTPILGIFGAPAAFVLCTVCYAIGLVLLSRVNTPAREITRSRQSLFSEFVAGLKYVWSQPVMRMIMILVILHCGLTMAFESLLPSISAQKLNAGDTGFGTLMIGVGAGALIAGLFVSGVQSNVTRGRFFLLTGVFSGFGQIMLAFATTVEMAIAAAVVMGGTQAAFMVLAQATTQSMASNEYRGRVASINTFSIGGVMASMNLANGALGTQFDAASILLVSGFIFVGIMIFSFAYALPRFVYFKGFPTSVQSTSTQPAKASAD